MEISEKLLCLFNTEIDESEETYTIEVPAQELEAGALDTGTTYRVAILRSGTGSSSTEPRSPQSPPDEPQPPVEVGEVRYVEIEDLGKQGDGIARVERGYVIIVPDADVGEQVKIEVTDVKSNFAVAEVIDEEIA